MYQGRIGSFRIPSPRIKFNRKIGCSYIFDRRNDETVLIATRENGWPGTERRGGGERKWLAGVSTSDGIKLVAIKREWKDSAESDGEDLE